MSLKDGEEMKVEKNLIKATNVRLHQHVINTLHLLVASRSGFSVETLLLHPAT